MSKKKGGNISVELPKKKSKRLEGILESMDMRSDPVSTHRVATEYFQSFKAQRNIQEDNGLQHNITAVHNAVATTNTTAVIIKNDIDYKRSNDFNEFSIDLLHTKSEEKVYRAIKSEILRSGAERVRIGLTKLKDITGLSDKTIRVAIHNLVNKKSINIINPSIGIYGRMFSAPPVKDIIEQRIKSSIEIDSSTKSVLPR